ncbi:MAG: hypothetical protein SOT58_10420 [Agathobacter sp.]|nr:hypothetical protein [Lachnobacterium sp.]MDY2912443.1 hypothetical protein [Agathobacter sp.]
MKTEEEFRAALSNKNIPLLVLDQKWHRLFAIHGKTDEIKEKEAKVNELLAQQGRANTELKKLKKIKNQLMDEIVQNMDDEDNDSAEREKKRLENKKLIDEVNEKINEEEDLLLELPKEIKEVNESLMILSMDYFYSKLRVNQTEAKEIEDWIAQVRIDLKKNIIRKQNRTINNKEIYSYLHDIFGAEVLDLFDIQYDDLIVGTSDNKDNKES